MASLALVDEANKRRWQQVASINGELQDEAWRTRQEGETTERNE